MLPIKGHHLCRFFSPVNDNGRLGWRFAGSDKMKIIINMYYRCRLETMQELTSNYRMPRHALPSAA